MRVRSFFSVKVAEKYGNICLQGYHKLVFGSLRCAELLLSVCRGSLLSGSVRLSELNSIKRASYVFLYKEFSCQSLFDRLRKRLCVIPHFNDVTPPLHFVF